MLSSLAPISLLSCPENEVNGGFSTINHDADSGGTIPSTVPESPGIRKRSPTSFASVVSSSSGGYSKSPLSTPSTPSMTQSPSRQKPTSPPSSRSSSGPSPLGNHNQNSDNSFVHSTSLNFCNKFSADTSTQSKFVSTSSMASLSGPLHNNLDSELAHNSSGDDFKNDQEDAKTSDVETHSKMLNMHNSAFRFQVLSDSSKSKFIAFGFDFLSIGHLHSRCYGPAVGLVLLLALLFIRRL